MLEQQGIGRPSTYAPTFSTIQEREYVAKEKGNFKPTELGFIVNDLLVEYFPDIVDIAFTARMEEELDDIAQGDKDWVKVMRDFILPLRKHWKKPSVMTKVKLPDELTDEDCPNCGKPLAVKTGVRQIPRLHWLSGMPLHRKYQIKTVLNVPNAVLNLFKG